ncbi:hypothetical protein DAI22_12g169100 [Oryza sativa Japonica Group]|nr:hypothetical protein DAI22_12g169100 [Oryza sativa Japonica Group]
MVEALVGRKTKAQLLEVGTQGSPRHYPKTDTRSKVETYVDTFGAKKKSTRSSAAEKNPKPRDPRPAPRVPRPRRPSTAPPPHRPRPQSPRAPSTAAASSPPRAASSLPSTADAPRRLLAAPNSGCAVVSTAAARRIVVLPITRHQRLLRPPATDTESSAHPQPPPTPPPLSQLQIRCRADSSSSSLSRTPPPPMPTTPLRAPSSEQSRDGRGAVVLLHPW